MEQGWITIHRKIQENALWLSDEPFDKRSAWIDLILMANHEDKTFLHGNVLTTVKRGSKITSLRKLSLKWKWSIKKVKTFLELLEELKMISLNESRKQTTYTIEKYSFYQDKKDTKETPLAIEKYSFSQGKGNTKETLKKHQGIHQGNIKETVKKTNNNDNNENNENKYIVEQNSTPFPYKKIIDYLNQKANKNYRSTSRKTQALIKARVNEGYTLEDFKKVIDNKTSEWLNNEKMQNYLRPETLFGTKFEGYLNQAVVEKNTNNQFSEENLPQWMRIPKETR